MLHNSVIYTSLLCYTYEIYEKYGKSKYSFMNMHIHIYYAICDFI